MYFQCTWNFDLLWGPSWGPGRHLGVRAAIFIYLLKSTLSLSVLPSSVSFPSSHFIILSSPSSLPSPCPSLYLRLTSQDLSFIHSSVFSSIDSAPVSSFHPLLLLSLIISLQSFTSLSSCFHHHLSVFPPPPSSSVLSSCPPLSSSVLPPSLSLSLALLPPCCEALSAGQPCKRDFLNLNVFHLVK